MRRIAFFIAALAATAMATTAIAADLAEITKRGRIIAATSGNLPPNTFVDSNNQLTGYDIEVARIVEKAVGIPIHFEKLDFKGIMPGLQTGRFDIVFSNVNITEERKQIFDYSIPYSRSAVIVLIPPNVQGISSFKDLKGRNVGGISGAADGEIPAKEISEKFGAFKSFKGYPGYAEMFTDLRTGRLDAIICPDLAAADFLNKNPGAGKILAEPYSVRFVGAPMQKGSTQLKAAVDAAIRKARQEGTLDQLAKKYFGLDQFSKELIDRVP
ncbi:MAG: amino acid ABC transporter substrate-binding protein [Alphaproteobacteria bacterium]|nr:amino acid ABC transporter substrate-binding protein [Alphaproteobacteria bacterium]